METLGKKSNKRSWKHNWTATAALNINIVLIPAMDIPYVHTILFTSVLNLFSSYPYKYNIKKLVEI